MDVTEARSRPTWESLDEFVRLEAQYFIQRVLEEEVEEFLGRRKSERRGPDGNNSGYRNGYGKPRKLSLSVGSIEVRPVRELPPRD